MKLSYESARRSVIWLLRFESLILLGLALYLLVAPLLSKVTVVSALIGELVFALLGSAGLFLASISYVREKSFGRAPAVLANLIALGISYFMISGHQLIIGIPLGALALATLITAIVGFAAN